MLRTEGVSMFLREGKPLTFMERNDEDAGFRGLDNGFLNQGFRGSYFSLVSVSKSSQVDARILEVGYVD